MIIAGKFNRPVKNFSSDNVFTIEFNFDFMALGRIPLNRALIKRPATERMLQQV